MFHLGTNEKKIDRIEDRLAGIEHVLEALSNKLSNLDLKSEFGQSSQSRSRPSNNRSPRAGSEVNNSTPAPFEGETTINRQSEFARELLEQAVGSTPSIIENAEIKAALTSLQDMVTRQGAYTNTMTTSLSYPFSSKSLVDVDHTKLERPPWELVNEVIDKASVYPTIVESYRSHARVCERQMGVAMSQLDLYLPATYENILALLLGSAHAVELCKPSLCWTMISTAAHLSQNLGYHRYQTMKDDSEEERNAKIHVFWFIYMMDKTLSLRLGRASIIQDWDMSLPYPNIDSDHARFGSLVQQGQKGTEMLLYWIKVAQIQGQAYEKLFSPGGSLRPVDERARIATELVENLNKAWSERGEVNVFDFNFLGIDYGDEDKRMGHPYGATPSERKRLRYVIPASTKLESRGPDMSFREVEEVETSGSFSYIGDIFYHADVVFHYSTCTLIQRAISPDNVTFNRDCLESARAALVAHQRCAAQFNIKGNEDLWSGYIHWAILQAPFTPFIVIFCNSILYCDPSDLNSLSEFVISLESCRTISEGADKLYKMCHLFLQVARLYVEAKTKESLSVAASPSQPNDGNIYTPDSGINLSTMTQFDPYLSALGLMPNATTWAMPEFSGMGAGTSLGAGVEPFPAGSFDATIGSSADVEVSQVPAVACRPERWKGPTAEHLQGFPALANHQ
ncbi:hypothetical protein GRF29_185g1266629 [Pseudopithomyces chartarum]|uniref:Xylanolytic transcriptional activator regulatory domain-containing protein n=1 Tax=Pseudopithomyces chartarum TaxID=1892770 RepID=A0AAN6LR23_9PLEO|nr:hypothetical protein GRF29_185g1266629 [Pseudopithomyces chartarum]